MDSISISSILNGNTLIAHTNNDPVINKFIKNGFSLYIVGDFKLKDSSDSIIATCIARYNIGTKKWSGLINQGTETEGLAGTTGTSINTIDIIDANIYVGGVFESIGGRIAHNVARYRTVTSEWQPLVDNNGFEGVDGNVETISIDFNASSSITAVNTSHVVIIGGGFNNVAYSNFQDAFQTSASNLVLWTENSAYTELVGGLNQDIPLTSYIDYQNSYLWLGGNFNGGLKLINLQSEPPQLVNLTNDQLVNNGVYLITKFANSETQILIGGAFTSNLNSLNLNRVAIINADASNNLNSLITGSTQITNGIVKAVNFYTSGDSVSELELVYLGGTFTEDLNTNSTLAIWDYKSSSFKQHSLNFNGQQIRDLIFFDNKLHVGGDFVNLDNQNIDYLAKLEFETNFATLGYDSIFEGDLKIKGQLEVDSITDRQNKSQIVLNSTSGKWVLKTESATAGTQLSRLTVDNGQQSTKIKMQSSNETAIATFQENRIDFNKRLEMGSQRITNLGDATVDNDAVSRSYADARYVELAGDTMTGVLDMGSNKITNVTDATNPKDALNRDAGDSRYVELAGDTMTGTLTVEDNVTANNGLSIYELVNTVLESVASFAYSTINFFRNLNMNNNKITGLADPEVDSDAVNKLYVDNIMASDKPVYYTGQFELEYVQVSDLSSTSYNLVLDNIEEAGQYRAEVLFNIYVDEPTKLTSKVSTTGDWLDVKLSVDGTNVIHSIDNRHYHKFIDFYSIPTLSDTRYELTLETTTNNENITIVCNSTSSQGSKITLNVDYIVKLYKIS